MTVMMSACTYLSTRWKGYCDCLHDEYLCKYLHSKGNQLLEDLKMMTPHQISTAAKFNNLTSQNSSRIAAHILGHSSVSWSNVQRHVPRPLLSKTRKTCLTDDMCHACLESNKSSQMDWLCGIILWERLDLSPMPSGALLRSKPHRPMPGSWEFTMWHSPEIVHP